MVFTLSVRIMGLGLFVPHEDQMHVLLPDWRGHQDHGVDEHEARLYYGPGLEAWHPFDNVRWDLSLLGSGQIDPELPELLPAVHEHAGRRGIRPGQLRKGEQERVHAHVILGNGRWTSHGPTAQFQVGAESKEMTNWLVWETSIDRADLPLAFEGMNDQPDSAHSALVPIDDRIEVEIVYVPIKEHENRHDEPKPEDCEESGGAHYMAYYALFPGTHGPQPKVRCECEYGSPAPRDEKALTPPIFGGKVYTCMLAQSVVE